MQLAIPLLKAVIIDVQYRISRINTFLICKKLFYLNNYCPFSDFESIVKKEDQEQGYVFCSELEIIKVNEHKELLLMNCSDLEKFGAMLEQPDLKQWDIDNNCKDTVYNFELAG